MQLSEISYFVFGNWKMAQSLSSAEDFVKSWSADPKIQSWDLERAKVKVGVFPSYVHLARLKEMAAPGLIIGAQDCSDESEGAYTGEVSAKMLKEIGVEWLILGHSERRQRAKEDNSLLRRKLDRAIEADLKVVFCVGESLQEREQGLVYEVLDKQLEVLNPAHKDLVLAYEPVWAIGTGKTPQMRDIEEVHQWINSRFPALPVLYGGSVKPENSKEILGVAGVRGLLVGGASLKKENFESIVQYALECQKF